MNKNGYEAAQEFLSDLNSKLTLEEWNLGHPLSDFLQRYNINQHTWNRVQKQLGREQLRTERESARSDRARIQKAIKERDVDELVADRFKGAKKEEVQWIKSRIINEVEAWDHHYEEDYTLANMLDEGLPGIRKQMRGKKFRWRYISWAWSILVNLFVILVVLSIYGHLTTTFEILVVSLLSLVYLSISGGHASWGQSAFAQLQFHAELYRNLRKAMGKDLNFAENAELDTLNKEHKKRQVKFWINASANSIVYYIVIWQLLKAVL